MKIASSILCICLPALTSCNLLIDKALDFSPVYVSPEGDQVAIISVQDRNPKGSEKYRLWISDVDDHKTSSVYYGVKSVAVEPGKHNVGVYSDSVYRIKNPMNGVERFHPYMNMTGGDSFEQNYKAGKHYVVSQDGRTIKIEQVAAPDMQ